MSTSIEVDERRELIASLQDKERRHYLASALIKRGLAEQIREMRDDRGWTQSELAQASNKVQETISQLENPNYGSYTIKTLERLAAAFDVALFVRFGPFSELVNRLVNISPEELAVPEFAQDSGLRPQPAIVVHARQTPAMPYVFQDYPIFHDFVLPKASIPNYQRVERAQTDPKRRTLITEDRTPQAQLRRAV